MLGFFMGEDRPASGLRELAAADVSRHHDLDAVHLPGGANRYESIYMYCVDLFPAEPRKFLKRKTYVVILSVFFVLSHAFSCCLPFFFYGLAYAVVLLDFWYTFLFLFFHSFILFLFP